MSSVYHGRWAFNGHRLYVTTSSGDVHPRATDMELDEIFTAPIGHQTSVPDYQDHWYEAQLLHFGIAPTQSKAAAKMRLMEAFQDGTLEIPMEILKIEAVLRKSWIKQDLESHLLAASVQHSRAPTIPAASTIPTGSTIPEPMEIDTPDHAATHKPEGEEEGNVLGAGLAGGAGMHGNMQLPHAHPKRKEYTNAELSPRPLKTARSRGEIDGSDLQVQVQVNPDGETSH